MKPNPQEYALALYDQLLETPTKHQPRTIRLMVDTVRQHQQIKAADKIIQAFSDLVDQKSQTTTLHLISAQPLNNLIYLSSQIAEEVGRDIEIRNYINKDIIGGLIIRWQNYKIDLSLQSHVQKARGSQTNEDKIPSELIEIMQIITANQAKLFDKEMPVKDKKIEIVDLSTAQKVKLAPLEKAFSAQLHQKVIIHYNQDPELIGGAIIKYDYNKIDSSLDQALEDAQEK